MCTIMENELILNLHMYTYTLTSLLFFIYRGANGLYLFPVSLRQTWSSIHVQLATVDVLIKAMLVAVHASTHTHTVILTFNAVVVEKVSNYTVVLYGTFVEVSLNSSILQQL